METRPDLLLSFYSCVFPVLLARFKEREESVRADIFSVFSTLLRQTRYHSRGASTTEPTARVSEEGTEMEEPVLAELKKQVDQNQTVLVDLQGSSVSFIGLCSRCFSYLTINISRVNMMINFIGYNTGVKHMAHEPKPARLEFRLGPLDEF